MSRVRQDFEDIQGADAFSFGVFDVWQPGVMGLKCKAKHFDWIDFGNDIVGNG